MPLVYIRNEWRFTSSSPVCVRSLPRSSGACRRVRCRRCWRFRDRCRRNRSPLPGCSRLRPPPPSQLYPAERLLVLSMRPLLRVSDLQSRGSSANWPTPLPFPSLSLPYRLYSWWSVRWKPASVPQKPPRSRRYLQELPPSPLPREQERLEQALLVFALLFPG